MTFGPKKIPGKDVVDAIVERLRDQLMNLDAFSNNSLAYYGVEIAYKVDLKLHSRGLVERGVSSEAVVGQKTDDKPKTIKHRDKASAGRKLKINPGEHTRESREGVEV